MPRALRLLLAGLLLCAAGCISLPDEVKADLEPPDGKRPNNFGTHEDDGTFRPPVRPDVPTIPAEQAQ
jgi:hypothetical protein